MKNRRFWLGLLVMVLTFGMTVVGCNNDSDNDKDTVGGNGGGGGVFTLTGIPSTYNNKYAVFFAGDADDAPLIVGAQSFTVSEAGMSGKAVQIKSGSVSLPLWTVSQTGVIRYTGNDTVEGGIMIFETESVSQSGSEPIVEWEFESITFSGGSASKTWSQGSDGSNSTPSTP